MKFRLFSLGEFLLLARSPLPVVDVELSIGPAWNHDFCLARFGLN